MQPLLVSPQMARHSMWLTAVVSALPNSWQATSLPGYVIVYEKSDPHIYKSALMYWRKDNGSVATVKGTPIYNKGKVTPDDPD